MKEEEMKQIGKWITAAIKETEAYRLPEDKEQRQETIKKAKAEIKKNKTLKQIRQEVKQLCRRFPLYK